MSIIQSEIFFLLCFKYDWWNEVQLNSRIPLVHTHCDADIVVKVTEADNFLPSVCAWKMREKVYKGRWSGGEESTHKANQNFTGTNKSFNWVWSKAPCRWWQSFQVGQEALHQTLCITWQNSAQLCRGVEFLVPCLAEVGMPFQRLCYLLKGVLSFLLSREKAPFFAMLTLSKDKEGVTHGHPGGRNHNAQVWEPPSSRASYCFPEANSNIHYHSPEKWHNWWLRAKQLEFLNAYCSIPPILPKAPLLIPSQFSRHFPQHWVCTVLNAMSKHDPVQSEKRVEYSACKNISRYSVMTTIILHVLLEEGDLESLKHIRCLQTAVKQDWSLCHWNA